MNNELMGRHIVKNRMIFINVFPLFLFRATVFHITVAFSEFVFHDSYIRKIQENIRILFSLVIVGRSTSWL